MGFALQLFSNATSRIIYMLLLGMLNHSNSVYSNPHATLLANATGLTALFSLNAYQYYLGRKSHNILEDLLPYQAQFNLLAAILTVTIATLLLSSQSQLANHWLLPTFASAIALTLPELIYTIATAQNRSWRPLVLYGGQSLFFIGYAWGVTRQESLSVATLYAATPTLLLNGVLFFMLRPPRTEMSAGYALIKLGETIRARIGTLAASAPVIATPPALVFLMNQSADGIPQVPQMLLFSSFVGAIVFAMGNVFQHYGQNLLPGLLQIQKQRRHLSLAGLLLGTLTLSLLLAMPVELLLTHLKSSFSHDWANNWYICAAMSATGTVILQWYTITCIHHGNTRPVLHANLLYIGMACFMTLASPDLGIHIFTTLAICSIVRAALNIADFSRTGRTAWRI